MHVRPRLPYYDSNEGLKKSSTNEEPIMDQYNGKIKLITHLCCPFNAYYLDLYCHLCCNIIVIVNAKFVAQRHI